MSDENTPDDGVTPQQQWAYLFNLFGEEQLRGLLLHCAGAFAEEDADRRVIEFRRTGDALDITDHVTTLEDQQTVANTETPNFDFNP